MSLPTDPQTALVAAGKNSKVVTAAIAREMAAFAWAIAVKVQPADAV